jgi:2-dehydro-3-deoxygluconokinase
MTVAAPEILTLGEPMLEFNEVSSGEGVHYMPGFGGDTSNFAVAAARQGARVAVLGRLGADAFGDRFLRLWENDGIETSLVKRDPEAPTGIYFVTHGPSGHQFTYYRRGSAASRCTPADIPLEAVEAARAVHVSGITQAISDSSCDAAFALMAAARERGALVSYDTNLRLKLWPLPRAKAVVMESVAQSDLCLPSLEDATVLTSLSDPDAIADEFLRRGARTVALKLGPAGVLVATGQERFRVPGFPVQLVDATGAGDTFGGAFLAEVLAGRDLRAAARYATAAAALAVTGYGAVGPIPLRPQVEAFLAKQGETA